VPEALRVHFIGDLWRDVYLHCYCNDDELRLSARVMMDCQLGKVLTMADDTSQQRIASGRATMYLTRLVKCSKRNKLPAKPQARENALKMSSL